MIVIINGPCGVGKTEVSWQLVAMFDQGVMLDGDYIGAVHPFEIHDDARVEHLYRTIHLLVAFQIEHGYSNFVVNDVFETPESLAKLRTMLSNLDDVTYAFRLSASEMEQRIRARNTEGVDWELKRFREIDAIMERGVGRGDMGFEVHTDGRSANEVAELIWQNIHEAVEIVPYEPAWAGAFQAEERAIQAALGELAVAVHHIGSTAVPGLEAKPIIDIMVVVRRLEEAVACIAPLRGLGYAFNDHPQNRDRRFFRKDARRPDGRRICRTHHLHIVEEGSESLRDHLAFRDALRSNAAWRREYADFKTGLAREHHRDRATYTEEKTAFVRKVLRTWSAEKEKK